MKQTPFPPIEKADIQNQTANYANYLSALYSIPLIESLYDNGISIQQMQNLADILTSLTSHNSYSVAYNLLLALYDFVPIERPTYLFSLRLFPVLIPCFLSEFLEDLDSLIEEFTLEEEDDV